MAMAIVWSSTRASRSCSDGSFCRAARPRTPGRGVWAKTITNCVANRWGDGPGTPAGVRDRAARQDDPSLQDLLARVDDQTIAMAMGDDGVRSRLGSDVGQVVEARS